MPVEPVDIVVYGTAWCAATQLVRRFLERMGLAYHYRDLDTDAEAARQVRWVAGGYASHPTVVVGERVLVEPSTTELQYVLRQMGLLQS